MTFEPSPDLFERSKSRTVRDLANTVSEMWPEFNFSLKSVY
jgi:hypothetical protein